MKRWQKFLLRFLGVTLFLFTFYKIGWPTYMSNIQYIAMAGAIGLFFSSFVTYADKLDK